MVGVALLERVSDGEALPDSVTVGVPVEATEALAVVEGEPEADAELEDELEVLAVEEALDEGEGDAELELETLGVEDGLMVAEGDMLGEAVVLPDMELVAECESVPLTEPVMLDDGLPDGDGEVLGETVSCGTHGRSGARGGGGDSNGG